MSLQPTPAILWGPNFQSRLDLGWPLDRVATYQLPRDGSRRLQTPSGVEDAWLVGPDFVLEGDARWLPANDQTVPVLADGFLRDGGFDDMMQWARGANKLRFLPDGSQPANYVDGYLVDPWDVAPSIEDDQTWAVRLKLRTNDRPFGQAMRGVVFEYVPGNGFPAGMVVGRTGVASYWGPTGKLLDAAQNVPRESALDLDGDGIYETVSYWGEGAATNLMENNDYETNANGSVAVGAVTVARDNNPLGTTARHGAYCCRLDLPNTSAVGVQFTKLDGTTRMAAVATGVYPFSVVLYVPPGSGLVGKNVDFAIEWWSATTGGSLLSTTTSTQALVAGWHRYSVVGTAPGSTLAAVPKILTNGAPGATYSFWFELQQLERQDGPQLPSSPIVSSTAGGTTRNADTAYSPWVLGAFPMCIYRKWVERGNGNYTFPNTFSLGDSANAAHRMYGYRGSGGGYGFAHYANAATPVTATQESGSHVNGDVWEFLYAVFADGSVNVWRSKNGAATTVGTPSGALIGGIQERFGDQANTDLRLAPTGGMDGAAVGNGDELLAFKVIAGTTLTALADPLAAARAA